MIGLAFHDLYALMHGRAVADVACPACGPERRSPLNRRRPVLRLWHSQPGFISFHCARCGAHGFIREDERREIDREAWQRQRVEMVKRDRDAAVEQARKVAFLWRSRMPVRHSLAEKYLHETRGITCPLPPTLAFLPARGDYPPAMIAAFGMAAEPEPGCIDIDTEAVRGVHLTRLRRDGSGKAEEPAKIMIGRSLGWPIVLAPMNDLLGLAIAEGIEDALSIHQATGLGAWAAGAASRLPAIADVVPDYADCVSIMVDADPAGRKGVAGLAVQLRRRRIHVDLIPLGAR